MTNPFESPEELSPTLFANVATHDDTENLVMHASLCVLVICLGSLMTYLFWNCISILYAATAFSVVLAIVSLPISLFVRARRFCLWFTACQFVLLLIGPIIAWFNPSVAAFYHAILYYLGAH